MTKVLVVEDDSFLVDAYSTKLRKAGFKVILATNGEEGLEQAADKKPDIILLDLLLPKRNGFDVLADLKEDEKLKKIPVIVLSNLGQERDVEQVRQLGAEDYLIKANVSMRDIITKINQLTKGKKVVKAKDVKSVTKKSEFKERTTDKIARKRKVNKQKAHQEKKLLKKALKKNEEIMDNVIDTKEESSEPKLKKKKHGKKHGKKHRVVEKEEPHVKKHKKIHKKKTVVDKKDVHKKKKVHKKKFFGLLKKKSIKKHKKNDDK